MRHRPISREWFRGKRYQKRYLEFVLKSDQEPFQSVSYVSIQALLCVLCVDTGLAKSNSEAKRLLSQGAIQIDGERVNADTVCIKAGSIIKVGKRRFVKIVDADKRS